MKIEFKQIVIDGGVEFLRVTTTDERWYKIQDKFLPSVSWIASYCPKDRFFEKYLLSQTAETAEKILLESSQFGTKVHNGVERLILGDTLSHDSKVMGQSGMEELTAEEWECLMSFINWVKDENVKFLVAPEWTVHEDEYGYAGTVDAPLAEVSGKLYVIDFKTSKNVYQSHIAQVSAYLYALRKNKTWNDVVAGRDVSIGILQLGKSTKKGYKFTDVPYDFESFLAARIFWDRAEKQKDPPQKDFPLTLSLR